MAEFAVATGILQVAGSAAQLGQALWKIGNDVRKANQDIGDITTEVRHISSILNNLGKLLPHDGQRTDSTTMLTEEARISLRECLEDCGNAFAELNKALLSASKTVAYGKLCISGRWRWPLNKSSTLALHSRLRGLTSMLSLMFQVLDLGRKTAEHTASANDRRNIERLLQSHEELVRKLNNPQRDTVARAASPAVGSAQPLAPLTQEARLASETARATADEASTQPTQLAPYEQNDKIFHQLQRCAAAVATLVSSLDTAMSDWRDRKLYDPAGLTKSYGAVTEIIGLLPAGPYCHYGGCKRRVTTFAGWVAHVKEAHGQHAFAGAETRDLSGLSLPSHHTGQCESKSKPIPANHQASASDHFALAGALSSQGTDNTYSATPSSAWADSTSAAGWLRQENLALANALGSNQISTYPADAPGLWQLASHTSDQTAQQPAFDYEQALPQRTRTSLTPTISLTTDLSGYPSGLQQAPQGTCYSASSNSSLPRQEDQYSNPFQNTHLSPQSTRFMAPLPRDNMNTPVSPVSAHSPRDNASLPELLSRKRSHSQMRGEAEAAPPPPLPLQSGHHSRTSSVASQAPNSASSAGEDYSPRGWRSFKRGDPSVNADNKYICDFATECAGQTFDRKCEWSKHMDKHDRPYRCPRPSCAKLQGFTYSGGLLRHEREVHNKHGGTKNTLMCPHEDCKRHVGKGFTRKENLNEHIRRVHENKSQLSQQPTHQESPSQYEDYKHQLEEAVAGVDQIMEPSVARVCKDQDADELVLEPTLGKRKRDCLKRSPPIDLKDTSVPEAHIHESQWPAFYRKESPTGSSSLRSHPRPAYYQQGYDHAPPASDDFSFELSRGPSDCFFGGVKAKTPKDERSMVDELLRRWTGVTVERM
ncbi:hypothetical protein LTR85_012280 [Meristemomyces frigidus]|nr:hypothetical protein LTR85_012280 [Meristemomyces frigidus]